MDASSATATTDTRKDDDGGGTKGLHKEKPVMDDPMEVQQIEGEGAKGVDEGEKDVVYRPARSRAHKQRCAQSVAEV